MADPVLHFLVIGHSFIVRADRYLYSQCDYNFTFPRVSHQVKLQGCSGAHVNDLMPLFHDAYFHSDVVILDIGTNDLTNNRITAQSLALQVFNTARRLTRYVGVKHVIILEVLPRTTWGKHGAPISFSSKVSHYNSMLKNLVFQYKETVPVTFWFHKGIASKIENYISDGVHLNSSGLQKYIKSVRRAILKTSRVVRTNYYR